MNSALRAFLVTGVLSVLTFLGCELVTESPPPPNLHRADHLVINEVFTLPSTHPSQYTWIEFYNPTSDTVDLTSWTITFNTERRNEFIRVALDSTLTQFKGFFTQQISAPTLGRWEVPIASQGISDEGELVLPPPLFPNELYTVVNNRARLLDHTMWGTASGFKTRSTPYLQEFPSLTVVFYDSTINRDSIVLEVSFKEYLFLVEPTEQLVLTHIEIDPVTQDTLKKEVVDVVRFGNYVYPGPGPDPFPNNHTIEFIPEFESIARYAGAYFTGNTVNDFFITHASERPVPQAYTQSSKP
jgi:hypothetical protein